MELNTTKDLSFYNDQGILTIPAKQYDTGRKFSFRLIADDAPLDMANCRVYLRALKADGTQFQGEECCMIHDGLVTVDTSVSNGDQLLTCAGTNQCEIHLTDSEGKSLTTWTFHIEVAPRVHDGTHIDSIDSWDAWDKMKDTVVDIQNKIDSHYFLLTADKDLPDGVPSLDENAKIPIAELYEATTARQGIVRLTDSVSSDSTTTAATPNSVKQVQDTLTAETERATAAEKKIQSTIDTNKSIWDDKYTKAEVDNKFSTLETNIDWKESVATYADIAVTYPTPQDGWTVNVNDTDYTYRYNGTAWIAISANAIPKATQEIDGLLSAGDKKKLDEMESKYLSLRGGTITGEESLTIDSWGLHGNGNQTITGFDNIVTSNLDTDDLSIHGQDIHSLFDDQYLNKSGDTMTDALTVADTAMPLSGGKVPGLAAGTSRLYGNGIVISNPATPNDQGWIRVTGTGESDTVLEIATGDDGGTGEEILLRQYNTSNTVARESKLLDRNGNTIFPGTVTAANFVDGNGLNLSNALSVRTPNSDASGYNTLKEFVEGVITTNTNVRSHSANCNLASGIFADLSGWVQYHATWQNHYNQNTYSIGLKVIIVSSYARVSPYYAQIEGQNGNYQVDRMEKLATSTDIDTLKTSFQAGCDKLSAAITAMGISTASGSSPDIMAGNIAALGSTYGYWYGAMKFLTGDGASGWGKLGINKVYAIPAGQTLSITTSKAAGTIEALMANWNPFKSELLQDGKGWDNWYYLSNYGFKQSPIIGSVVNTQRTNTYYMTCGVTTNGRGLLLGAIGYRLSGSNTWDIAYFLVISY